MIICNNDKDNDNDNDINININLNINGGDGGDRSDGGDEGDRGGGKFARCSRLDTWMEDSPSSRGKQVSLLRPAPKTASPCPAGA